MYEKLADATLQSWLSELPYYEPWHLGWNFAEIEVPVMGRREPVKAPAFIGFLETENAVIRIECVAAEDHAPRGYMRGSIATWHVVDGASEESSVEWEELGDGRFDRTTLMEILAMAFSYELVGDDDEGCTPPEADADPEDAPSSRAGGAGSHLPPFLAN